MRRPAVYARLSPVDKRKQERSMSVDAQLEAARALCAERGLGDPLEYVDRSASASDRSKPRPAFARMMADIQAGRVSAIVCRDDDRLVRRPAELEGIIDVLEPRGIPVFFTHSSNYDLTTSAGRAAARIMGAISRQEVEKKSERQKMNNAHRASAGLPYKSVRAFGYQFDESSNFVIDPVEAEAIRWAHTHVMRGGTMGSVAREWNARGLTTVRGNKWAMFSAKQALLNAALAGYRAYHPTTVLVEKTEESKRPPSHLRDLTKGAWEPILSTVEWEAMVFVLTQRRSSAGNRIKHLGAGIYVCGIHNVTVTTGHRTLRSGENVRAYRCRERAHTSVVAAPIDEYVNQTVRDLLANPYVYEDVFGDDAPSVDVAAVEVERAALNKRLEELAVSFAAQRIPLVVLEAATAEIQGRLALLGAEVAESEAEAEARGMFMDAETVRAVWDTADIEIRRQILRELYPRIVVFPSGGDRSGRPPAYTYVHMYDRRGRLEPLPISEEEHNMNLQQVAHAARYGVTLTL
jgi:site-specific DNA recombinase